MAIIVKMFSKDTKSLQAIIYKVTTQLAEKHTKILADATQVELHKNVNETRERVQKPIGPHLTDAINTEKVDGGWGVGNIEVMNVITPWWAWINYGRAFSGREIPPGTKDDPAIMGHFEPSVKGVFTPGSPKYPIAPKKPIAAHNYIEKALSYMYGAIKSGGLLK